MYTPTYIHMYIYHSEGRKPKHPDPPSQVEQRTTDGTKPFAL